jgi:hypothetical protein
MHEFAKTCYAARTLCCLDQRAVEVPDQTITFLRDMVEHTRRREEKQDNATFGTFWMFLSISPVSDLRDDNPSPVWLRHADLHCLATRQHLAPRARIG